VLFDHHVEWRFARAKPGQLRMFRHFFGNRGEGLVDRLGVHLKAQQPLAWSQIFYRHIHRQTFSFSSEFSYPAAVALGPDAPERPQNSERSR